MKHFVSVAKGAPVHCSETRDEPTASARCGSDISEPTESHCQTKHLLSLPGAESSVLSRGRIAPLENATGRHGHLGLGAKEN